jgi:hypothetical protein
MTDEAFDSETRKQGPLSFLIEWYYDNDPDVSYLGEGTDKPKWDGPVYDRWTEHLWVSGTWYDKNGRALTESDYEDVEASGDRRSYRYIVGFQHPGTAKEFDDCPQLHPEILAKHGDLDQASRTYCFEDAKRLNDYFANQWWVIGCQVTLTVDGEELAQDSLWGIESDAEESYRKEIENERISECKAQALASLPKTIDRLNKLRRTLEDLVPKALQS